MQVAATPTRIARPTFARQGYMVISAERLTAAYASTETRDSIVSRNIAGSPSTGTSSGTSSDVGVAFLGSAYQSWSALPRLAYDHFVVDGLSLGISFVYASRSDTDDTEFADDGRTSTQTTSPRRSAWLVNSRVGYGVALSNVIGFWGRVGFTFVSNTEDRVTTQSDPTTGAVTTSTSKISTTTPWLVVEPLFVLSPIDHFGIVLGPFLDLGLGGSWNAESTFALSSGSQKVEGKFNQTSFGLTLGIAGWF
jgi:hypothetical protein